MLRKEKNGIHWLQFNLLTDIPGLKHGVFLRPGGSSTGIYEGLNLSERVGDYSTDVASNWNKAKNALGIHEIRVSEQCHGIDINEIHLQDECLRGDAMITKQPHLGLMIHHADCQAALMYDPKHHVIANVHSGWRGSVQNIYAATIERLKVNYGTDAADLIVCISPSLGPQNAEFINYRTELPEAFWEFQEKPNYFDFWEISRKQLLQCGVLDKHIEIASIDTYSNPSDYYSYRRDGITGRNGTVIMLM